MFITGIWNINVSTPVGAQPFVLELTESNGVVQGTAKGDSETMPLIDPVLNGNRLTWKLAITKPMRLTFSFDVTIDGNTLAGSSKVGMLPSSKVTGARADVVPQKEKSL